ncbi:MAG: hypothetical protein ACRELF_18000 [Gemmataceae bacterium]
MDIITLGSDVLFVCAPGIGRFAAAVPEEAWEESMSQQALAERFGKSRDQVRGVLERMKMRARRLLHIELRDHGASEADIEAEAAELLRSLSR